MQPESCCCWRMIEGSTGEQIWSSRRRHNWWKDQTISILTYASAWKLYVLYNCSFLKMIVSHIHNMVTNCHWALQIEYARVHVRCRKKPDKLLMHTSKRRSKAKPWRPCNQPSNPLLSILLLPHSLRTISLHILPACSIPTAMLSLSTYIRTYNTVEFSDIYLQLEKRDCCCCCCWSRNGQYCTWPSEDRKSYIVYAIRSQFFFFSLNCGWERGSTRLSVGQWPLSWEGRPDGRTDGQAFRKPKQVKLLLLLLLHRMEE